MARRRLRACVLILSLSCGEGETERGTPVVVEETCPITDSPSFELGTGELSFEPMAEGSDLWMVQGIQGGCHFPVSVRTSGFAERRLEIAYRVLDGATLEETLSRSSTRVRLSGIANSEVCEFVGMTAYLIEPWTLVDRSLVLEVTVTDDLGRARIERRRIVARGKPGTICVTPPG
ncbi:MAG: hypothetical protein HY791_34930 [Deltaproteobacteria bacterium]|nr:hypothetical protein [Deltaproteobacteria bacterium]